MKSPEKCVEFVNQSTRTPELGDVAICYHGAIHEYNGKHWRYLNRWLHPIKYRQAREAALQAARKELAHFLKHLVEHHDNHHDNHEKATVSPAFFNLN